MTNDEMLKATSGRDTGNEVSGSRQERLVIPETTERTLTLGRELFKFTSEQEWVNKAQSWFRNKAPQKGNYVAVDEAGRVCTMGKHFMRATTEDSYPITVYVLTV